MRVDTDCTLRDCLVQGPLSVTRLPSKQPYDHLSFSLNKLDSASDDDNVSEEVDGSVARDHATKSGPKDYISAVREKLAMDLDPRLPQPARCIGLAHSWEKVDSRQMILRICCFMVLSR